jgi:hypothetical protein
MNTQSAVVELARRKHGEGWITTSNVSDATVGAVAVCRAWQQAVHDSYPNRFTSECVVGSECNEKIDLVDTHELVAYEFKVSPNNARFEIYKDIFKVWVQRELGGEPLKKLVFITPAKGAKSLKKSFFTKSQPWQPSTASRLKSLKYSRVRC